MAVSSMGPAPKTNISDGIPKPKSFKEIPAYLFKRAKGFVTRLFYIISLVWEASPPVLIIMALLCIFNGVLPIIGAYITRDLINVVAELIGTASKGTVYDN